MRFLVRAVQNGQAIVALELDAPSQVEARQQAEAKGLTVLSVSGQEGRFVLSFSRPTRFDLVLFSQELLALLDAGINVVEALETLSEKEHRSDSKHILAQVVAHLHDGQPLSGALQRLPEIFPPLYVATVRASERTGDLAEGLTRYVSYANQLDVVRKKLVSASIYPLILIGAGGLVMAFLLGYIVPKFARIYEDMGNNLPLMSRLLLQWGKFVEAHGMLLLASCTAFVIAIAYLFSRPEFRKRLIDRLWTIPTVGERLRIYQLARFYRTLGMLLRGGIPVATALDMVGGLLQPAFQPRLNAALGAIREGKTISIAFNDHNLATPVALRMLRVGERSGRMGEMMERIAAFYDDEIARWVDWFTRLFEPILMAFIGLIIGIIVVLMYLPIFELAGGLQ
jgi:general secretion pathway protein F